MPELKYGYGTTDRYDRIYGTGCRRWMTDFFCGCLVVLWNVLFWAVLIAIFAGIVSLIRWVAN